MGPLIKTAMTRCIQCTRCVRFITEVAGMSEIGLISRGEDVEITTYLDKAVTSELSANVIDLCPVGALTSKPYAFSTRPWELSKTPSVDVMDALGSSIRVDSRGPAVLRVLPRTNDEINEEWLDDKSRFACDGLNRQRLDRPMVRRNGRLTPTTWNDAFAIVAQKLKAAAPDRIGAIAGDLQDAESMKATMDLFRSLGSPNLDCRQDGTALGVGPRESWLLNSTIAGLEKADAILFVGTNPRREAAVLNARFRKMWLAGTTSFGLIGEAVDLSYGYEHLGSGADAFAALNGDAEFARIFRDAKYPAVVVGQGALAGHGGPAVLRAAAKVAGGVARDGWNGWNVLHTAAARVGGLDMGFVPGNDGKTAGEMVAKAGLDVLFLLGADEIDLSRTDAFVIYLGTHGDAGAHRADIILPGADYTEKHGLYVNTEGRVQRGERAVFPKGEGKEDWTILRALSEIIGAKLPYDTLDQLRDKLFADHPTFGQLDLAPGSIVRSFDLSGLGAEGELTAAPLRSPIHAFHLTNPIARASVIMAECAALASGLKMAAE